MPEAARAHASAQLRQLLMNTEAPVVGMSSLAVGADQLFAEIVLESGGELYAVLPSKNYEETFASSDDLDRFTRLLSQAETIEVLSYDHPSELAFLEAGKSIASRADLLVAVWDGEPSRGMGGTADVVRYARDLGTPVLVLWPEGVQR